MVVLHYLGTLNLIYITVFFYLIIPPVPQGLCYHSAKQSLAAIGVTDVLNFLVLMGRHRPCRSLIDLTTTRIGKTRSGLRYSIWILVNTDYQIPDMESVFRTVGFSLLTSSRVWLKCLYYFEGREGQHDREHAHA